MAEVCDLTAPVRTTIKWEQHGEDYPFNYSDVTASFGQ